MNKFFIGVVTIIALILTVALFAALGYLIVAGLTFLICYCFGMEWSWIYALGIYLIMVFLSMAYKWITGGNKKNA